MPDNSRKETIGWGFGGILSIVFLIGLAAVTLIGGFAYLAPEEAKQLGQIGDFVGGLLNPFLTFLTFIGLLLTLRLQKQELVLTRIELERSANALENQLTALKQQSFENTYFRLLELHNSIVNSIDLVRNEKRTQGRDCFAVFYQRLKGKYTVTCRVRSALGRDEQLRESYDAFWPEHQLELGHYFRYLFNVIRFIDSNPKSDPFYIKLLRSQLSDQELLLLFYNCLSTQGTKFKEYAEKYALFDNMPTDRLLDPSHKDRFNVSAFGEHSTN